jgi:flagellar protein FlaD
MAEQQDTTNQQLLDENALKAELATLVAHNQLPTRIAQKLGDKIQEKHLHLTKNQLLRLAERLQTILQAIPNPQTTPTQTQTNHPTSSEDMKRLYDEVANLKDRLQAIELTNHDTRTTSQTRPTHHTHNPPASETIQPLETIPSDPTSIIVVMKWLTFMVQRIGKESLPDVLDYYVDISWISDDVRLDLINYAKGITDDTTQTDRDTSNLPTKDHLQSLLYIQKLKGIDLDDRFLLKIDREMEKMTKSLVNYTPNPHHLKE